MSAIQVWKRQHSAMCMHKPQQSWRHKCGAGQLDVFIVHCRSPASHVGQLMHCPQTMYAADAHVFCCVSSPASSGDDIDQDDFSPPSPALSDESEQQTAADILLVEQLPDVVVCRSRQKASPATAQQQPSFSGKSPSLILQCLLESTSAPSILEIAQTCCS